MRPVAHRDLLLCLPQRRLHACSRLRLSRARRLGRSRANSGLRGLARRLLCSDLGLRHRRARLGARALDLGRPELQLELRLLRARGRRRRRVPQLLGRGSRRLGLPLCGRQPRGRVASLGARLGRGGAG